MYNCTRCGRQIESWDDNYFGRGLLCPMCHSEARRREHEKSALCTRCGLRISPSDANMKLGRTLCSQCYEDMVKEKRESFCASCGRRLEGASFQRPDGYRLCLDCMRDQSPGGGSRMGVRSCDRCGNREILQYVTDEGERICKKCASKHSDKALLRRLTDAITSLRR